LDSLAGASLDLPTLARLYQEGETPLQVLVEIHKRMGTSKDSSIWIYRVPAETLRNQGEHLQSRRAAGENMPLFGVPFAVKDNIDVAGLPTTAGCPAFAYTPERTAPAVERLQKAGALLVGKTNLDQFATGLAGDRSPYGACRNVFNPKYISGGSSSGSAVAVAAGLVSFALGTDTAGSGRVPAGCNNIVGLKPTPGLLSTEGVVPASRSFDCVSIFALTADDAQRVCDVAAGEPCSHYPSPSVLEEDSAGFTFAVPRAEDLEFYGDSEQARLFGKSVAALERLGGRPRTIDFRPLREVAELLYDGPWLAERLAGLEDFLKAHAADVFPVTREILMRGARFSGVDVFRAQARLSSLRFRCAEIFKEAETLVVPTMPALPTLAEVQADSVGWSRRLGHYTNFVNLLGWAALAVPAGFTQSGLPAGLTLIGPGGSDRRLCRLGMAWQRLLDMPLGGTSHRLPAPTLIGADAGTPAPAPTGWVRVAVAGAHLRGQPWHSGLRELGARFVRACRTAARYRFVGLMDLKPPRPGLIRDDARAGSAAVEVYDITHAAFGKLVASVAPPLAIGTIELADGECVKGFLCESWAAATARDITDFGGWLVFLERQALATPHSSGAGKP
jgi:allophanate hydrolase